MNVIELLSNIDGVKEVDEMAENHRWFIYVEPNEAVSYTHLTLPTTERV